MAFRHGPFAFPGNTDFAADDQGAFSRIIFERLLCLFIVCETMFTIGESRTISYANDTQRQQMASNPRPGRFSTETPLEQERRLQIQREQRGRRRQQETAEQREHRLACTAKATPKTRDRGTGDWNIRGIMIVLRCGKPKFISLLLSPPISLQSFSSVLRPEV